MSRDYYSFDRIFDRVHELGGVTGFAHQGISFHGYRGYIVKFPYHLRVFRPHVHQLLTVGNAGL